MSPSDPRPHRRGAADQFRTLIRQAKELAAPLDPETFNRPPEDGGWSVAECLEHLNATARVYLPVLTEAIADARDRGLVNGRRDGRTLFGRLVAWAMEPPVRFRMRTSRELAPGDPGGDAPGAPRLDPDVVLEEFEALHEELIVRINESTDLDRRRVRVRSVIDRRLRLSLDDWFAFLAAHARRHLWQAGRVIGT